MSIEVRVLRVARWSAAAVGEEASLSAEERGRAAAFVRKADRDRYLVAHTALRRELGRRLGVRPGEVTLTREACPLCGGPHGRPSVPGHPLHFSLSHAGGLVLLAFAPVPVGVDVEVCPEPGLVADIAKTLHPGERAELANLPEPLRPVAFARCWTRKEAYLKGTGTGLGEDPSTTRVGTLESPEAVPGWTLEDIPVPAGHAAAYALATARPSP